MYCQLTWQISCQQVEPPLFLGQQNSKIALQMRFTAHQTASIISNPIFLAGSCYTIYSVEGRDYIKLLSGLYVNPH